MEYKYYDTTRVSASIVSTNDATGGEIDPTTLDTISAPDQGDGESQRDGRSIMIKKVNIKGMVRVTKQANQTGADIAPLVFITLVQDKQTNKAQLNSEDVYTNGTGSASMAATPFRNLKFISRFTVLKTKMLQINTPDSVFDGTNIEQSGRDYFFRMDHEFRKGMMVNFTGTGAGLTNVIDNSLHMIAYCSTTALAPTINYVSRIRYLG